MPYDLGVINPERSFGGSLSRVAQNSIGYSGGGSPDQVAAQITREQWQHFLDTYRPVEDEVLQRAMQTDYTGEGDAAGVTAMQGVNAARGSLTRSLSRAGTSLSVEERSAVARRTDLARAKAVGRAENTTRRGLYEARSNLLAGIVGIGRGVGRSASGAAQSVADMAAQREAVYQQQKSQASATNISSAASLAALLISI